MSVKCEGAVPVRMRRGFKCPECGLFVAWDKERPNANVNHEILMQGRHWNRPEKPGANPFTESGLYGKAAQAADGDWYGSH